MHYNSIEHVYCVFEQGHFFRLPVGNAGARAGFQERKGNAGMMFLPTP